MACWPRVPPLGHPVSDRRIVAHQLSLLGDAPKPCYSWRPTFYQWTFYGIPLPPCDDTLRQARLMRRETVGLEHGMQQGGRETNDAAR